MTMFTVYVIKYKEDPIYVGMTNNISRRTKEHNKGIKGDTKKTKDLYKFLSSEGVTEVELIPIRQFSTRKEAKYYEAFLILKSYFGRKTLKQKVPMITDTPEWLSERTPQEPPSSTGWIFKL